MKRVAQTDPRRWRQSLLHSAAFLCVLLFSGGLVAESLPAVTLVKAARLLDPKTGNVLSPAAILIENGKIKEVGTAEQ